MCLNDFKTEVLGETESALHRESILKNGGKWKCESCGFEELSIIAWRESTKEPIRMSCPECHLYEDPLRYRYQVALAYLPVIPRHVLSHIIRLMLATSPRGLGLAIAEYAASAEALPSVKTLEKKITRPQNEIDLAPHKRPKSKFENAINGFMEKMGANIGYGLEFAQTIFPDDDMTLRVLANGHAEAMDDLTAGLRLIPTSIRSDRVEAWKFRITDGLLADVKAFAEENISPTSVPEDGPVEQSDSAANDDDGKFDLRAADFDDDDDYDYDTSTLFKDDDQ